MKFELVSDFLPTGDQPQAISALLKGIEAKQKFQVLLGVTGSGKTFTMANVIQSIQKPTLVISHNKTLAAQLYQEFRNFFPNNAVCYFVSYYDYYQPEAYLPQTDTYIEKETDINEEIDKLRLEATTNLLTRKDVVIISSVSCIYNLGSPKEYARSILDLSLKKPQNLRSTVKKLIELQYIRSSYELKRSSFRIRGDALQLWPAYTTHALNISFLDDRIENIKRFDPLTGNYFQDEGSKILELVIYPAKHYVADAKIQKNALIQIKIDLNNRLKELEFQGKQLEAYRLRQRVNYDLDMIREFGYVNGIENYSRYFDGRQTGEPPYTLLDYFQESAADFQVFIDESHITVPQLRGMYEGDRSRKQTLIEYGFRLPAALDNRPLNFNEFLSRVPRVIFISATPSNWERSVSSKTVEQLIRPTGLLDPQIVIRKTEKQIDNLISEIQKRVEAGERVLVTTLTKRTAEILSDYLEKKSVKVHYLHSEVQTFARSDILDDLRAGRYDVVVGINLLREGLDLPEVSLVAILDADKEGFLRSETSLIQTMGRAARHIHGQVILYADNFTKSMQNAIDEVNRRRNVQILYNRRYGIIPKTVEKPIREKLFKRQEQPLSTQQQIQLPDAMLKFTALDIDALTPKDKKLLLKNLKKIMNLAAKNLEFEKAAYIRDKINSLKP